MKSISRTADLDPLPQPLRMFLESAAKSASNIISILVALEKHGLLSISHLSRFLLSVEVNKKIDTFLPFDPECLFTATFFLTLFSLLRPQNVNCRFHGLAYHLLNILISKGNDTACLRRSELDYLGNILWTLHGSLI